MRTTRTCLQRFLWWYQIQIFPPFEYDSIEQENLTDKQSTEKFVWLRRRTSVPWFGNMATPMLWLASIWFFFRVSWSSDALFYLFIFRSDALWSFTTLQCHKMWHFFTFKYSLKKNRYKVWPWLYFSGWNFAPPFANKATGRCLVRINYIFSWRAIYRVALNEGPINFDGERYGI